MEKSAKIQEKDLQINKLCNEMEDCKTKDCKLEHPKLMMGICVKNLKKECYEGDDGCYDGRIHKPLLDLLKIANKNPELLDSLKKDLKNAFLFNFKKFIKNSLQRRLEEISQSEIDEHTKAAVEIKRRCNCELLFIMDTTGSMSPWIKEIQEKLLDIIAMFRKKFKRYKLRVGFIGYKDFGDKGHLDKIDFTEDYDKVIELISNQKATGGGDEPEDIIAALKLALPPIQGEERKVEEEENCAIFKYREGHTTCVLFIGDAPSHGRQYHSPSMSDSKPDIPENTLENIMKRYSQRPNLYFVCIRLTSACDIMYERMKVGLPNLQISNSRDPKDLFNIATGSIEKSITKTFYTPTGEEFKITDNWFKNIKAKRTIASFSKSPLKDTPAEMNEFYWRTLYDNVELLHKDTMIRIDQQKPLFGTESFVLFGEDTDSNVAFKIPRYVIPEKPDGIPFYNQYEAISNKMRNQVYAYQMAKYFRKLTATNLHAPNLYYLKPIMYTLQEPINGIKYLYGELMIEDKDSKGKEFEKYMNNQSWVGNELIAAFGHFTYDASEGYFMVTDLQGKNNILSDPAIHSCDKKEFTSRTNLRERGYDQFFEVQHPYCVKNICGELGLKRPQWSPFEAKYEEEQNISVIKPSDIVKMFCEKCAQIKDIEFNKFKEFYNDRDDTMCLQCHGAE